MIDEDLAEMPTQEIGRHFGAAGRHVLTGLATVASRRADASAAAAREAAQRVRDDTDLAQAVNRYSDTTAVEADAEAETESDGRVEIPNMTDQARQSYNLANYEDDGARAVALDREDLGVGTITDIDISDDDVTYTVTFPGNGGEDIILDLDGHELHILTPNPPEQRPGTGQILDVDGIREMTEEERAEHTLTHGEPGTRVRARDRGNIGTITDIDDDAGKVTVYFKNDEGYAATRNFDAHDLDVLDPAGRTITPEPAEPAAAEPGQESGADRDTDAARQLAADNPMHTDARAAEQPEATPVKPGADRDTVAIGRRPSTGSIEARHGPGIDTDAARQLAAEWQSRWADTSTDPTNVAARHLGAAQDLANRWHGRWSDSHAANDPAPDRARHQQNDHGRDELGR